MLIVFATSFPSHSEHSAHSYDTSAVLTEILLTEFRQQPENCFEISTIFFRFFLWQISCSNFWLDYSFQVTAQALYDIRLRANSLKFSA